MSKILLSIIIPVYNVDLYLDQCLESILKQDLDDCEIIIVNDGSTDHSIEIIEKYKDRYSCSTLVISQDNSGLSAARNTGVQHCKGDYIYFVDSDDYLADEAIATIKEIIANDHNTSDLFQLDNIITTYGKRLACFSEDFQILSIREYFVKYHTNDSMNAVVCAVSFIFSSKFWRMNNLSYECRRRYEDRLFMYNLLCVEGIIKIIHVNDPFYIFRQNREGSISTSVTIEHYRDRQYIWRKAFNIFKAQGLIEKAYYHNIFIFCHWVLQEAYMTGNIDNYKSFFDSNDLQIMRYGISNFLERKIWLLLKLNPILMLKYYNDALPNLQRRIINICFTILDKLLPNWWIIKGL